jgi:hypothetical protein
MHPWSYASVRLYGALYRNRHRRNTARVGAVGNYLAIRAALSLHRYADAVPVTMKGEGDLATRVPCSVLKRCTSAGTCPS